MWAHDQNFIHLQFIGVETDRKPIAKYQKYL